MPENKVGANKKVDLRLRKVYPISGRYIWKELASPWSVMIGILLAIVLCISLAVEIGRLFEPDSSGVKAGEAALGAPIVFYLQAGSMVAFVSFVLVLLFRGIYLKLSEMAYYYAVQGNQFVIRRGIVLKETIVFPLRNLTEVYVEQKPWDFVFGLCDLVVTTPAAHPSPVARIPGLRRPVAMKLASYLGHLVGKNASVEAPMA